MKTMEQLKKFISGSLELDRQKKELIDRRIQEKIDFLRLLESLEKEKASSAN